MSAESVCIDQTPVEVAGWSIPKIGNFPKHMLTLLDKFHQKIHADWLVQSERMRLEYTMEGKEVVQIPPPPTLLELKLIINFVRGNEGGNEAGNGQRGNDVEAGTNESRANETAPVCYGKT